MKYVDEFRDPAAVAAMAEALKRTVSRPWTVMEVCGGQTHSIVKHGLDQLLPPGLELLHGPGCPVCVTPGEVIDAAIAVAARPDVILCSFGDMLRVPGQDGGDLLTAKAKGADVRIVYSPAEAVTLARETSGRQVVFLAVGFETTAPANAHAVLLADAWQLTNFSMIVAHVLVPPALTALLAAPDRRVDGFLAAGHVCTVMGSAEYEPIARRYRVPIVITGFEPADIMQGLLLCVRQLEAGRGEVENQYTRAVRPGGNAVAMAMMAQVFEVRTAAWRGLGAIAASGLGLRGPFARFDAFGRFPEPAAAERPPRPPSACRAGEVLTGRLKPDRCPEFGRACTPERPLGAPMVSSEGACAAYFHYRHARGKDQ